MEAENTALLDQIRELIDEGDWDSVLTALSSLHPADQAEVVADLAPDQRSRVISALPREQLAALLGYLPPDDRSRLAADVVPWTMGPLLDMVEPDVAADVLHALPPEQVPRVLQSMRSGPSVARLLRHPDESAGGRMTPGLVALQEYMTVSQAMAFLRRLRPDPEAVYYLYVVDAAHRLTGVVSLRQLVIAGPDARIGQIMTREVITVPVGTDQEECARLIQRYNLVALPVVDEQGKLAGVVTVDDLFDVVAEEATEDMFRMVGLPETESLFRPITASAPSRFVWLLVNLPTALLAAFVVSLFEPTIAKVAALAIFMPIIAGMGGNAGMQTVTMVVRAMALGDLAPREAWPILRRELAVGLALGLGIGLTVGLVAMGWRASPLLGLIAGSAMLINLLAAAGAGVLVPLTLRMLRLDPALASSILVTTVTDVTGFLSFLGLATIVVDRLT
jgi:magnesium transporter